MVKVFDEDAGSIDDSLGKCSILINKNVPFVKQDGESVRQFFNTDTSVDTVPPTKRLGPAPLTHLSPYPCCCYCWYSTD